MLMLWFVALWSRFVPHPAQNSFLPSLFQMEDDVEVELELEKQLSLAHELF